MYPDTCARHKLITSTYVQEIPYEGKYYRTA